MEVQGPVIMYESECPAVSGNRHAEMGVIQLAITFGEDTEALWSLDPRDFYYTDCRFVFSELVLMREANQPLTDKASLGSWFRRPDVAQRMKREKLDWFEDGKPVPFSAILEMVVDGDFATVAHIPWYIQELRKWRVVRGLRRLAWDLGLGVDRDEPAKVIEWLEEKVTQLKEVAGPILERKEDENN